MERSLRCSPSSTCILMFRVTYLVFCKSISLFKKWQSSWTLLQTFHTILLLTKGSFLHKPVCVFRNVVGVYTLSVFNNSRIYKVHTPLCSFVTRKLGAAELVLVNPCCVCSFSESKLELSAVAADAMKTMSAVCGNMQGSYPGKNYRLST